MDNDISGIGLSMDQRIRIMELAVNISVSGSVIDTYTSMIQAICHSESLRTVLHTADKNLP